MPFRAYDRVHSRLFEFFTLWNDFTWYSLVSNLKRATHKSQLGLETLNPKP